MDANRSAGTCGPRDCTTDAPGHAPVCATYYAAGRRLIGISILTRFLKLPLTGYEDGEK